MKFEKQEEDFNLNDKQKKFFREYLVDYNQTQAAKRAGYSEKSAYSQGNALMKHPEAREYLDFLLSDLQKLSGVTHLRNIQELAKIAYGNIADLFTDWENLKSFDDIPDELKGLVQEVSVIKTTRAETTKVKFYSKLSALQELNQMMGFNKPQQLEVKTRIDFTD